MIKTYEHIPQLTVHVDGYPAVCQNLDCDFAYVEPVGEISGFTFDLASKKVVITGTNLPSVMTDIRNITFAKTNCEIVESTLTSTGVDCILEREPTCGANFLPNYIHKLGKIPVASTATGVNVDCTVTAVTPDTPLNLLGGNYLFFTGTNLPWTDFGNDVELKFSDSQSTTCTIDHWVSGAEIGCKTNPFSESDAGQTLNVILTINGQPATIDNSITVVLRSEMHQVVTMVPTSSSPVLKRPITFTITDTFPYTLAKEDFRVTAISQDDPSYIKYLNVISVDDAAKSFTAMFGGAYSGMFDIEILHTTFGTIKSSDFTLDVSAEVTSVSTN